jgi:TatD DNase family protein
VPLDRLLVETDSPFLAPVPHRKQKRNEPALVAHVVSALADIHARPADAMARRTTANFHTLFGP